MHLPKNGRIAIIDDQINEVQPLFRVLSKERIPYNYYSGSNVADLPENPDDNPITVLFLDLNLVETQSSSKMVISTLHPILNAICPGKSKPYYIVIWSKKISQYSEDLKEHFKIDSQLKMKMPVKFINLNKSDFFEYDIDTSYTFRENTFKDLIIQIEEDLKDLSLLRNLINWENIVHAKTSETISEFTSIYPVDSEWDKKSKSVIYHLAKSILGSDEIDKKVIKIVDGAELEINKFSDEQKMAKGFIHINSFLAEKIENEVEELKLGQVSDISDNTYHPKNNKEGSLSKEIRAKVNSKLHIFNKENSIKILEQGNVYVYEADQNETIKILSKKEYGGNATKKVEIISSNPQLIEMDLTPVCDYSQKKGYARLLNGLLIDHSFYKDIDGKELYYYKTPLFNWNQCIVFILFDFRYVHTLFEQELENKSSFLKFKFRREICTDIQSQLANQINRPGVSNL